MVFSRTEMDMKRATLPQTLFEIGVLRLTDIRPFHVLDELINKVSEMEDNSQAELSGTSIPSSQNPLALVQAKTQEFVRKKETNKNLPDNGGLASASSDNETNFFQGKDVRVLWEKAQIDIRQKKNSFGHFFENCQPSVTPPSTLKLDFPDPFTLGLVDKEENREMILESVEVVFFALAIFWCVCTC